jgi:crotonobetaine/carnitine-CoA ligase
MSAALDRLRRLVGSDRATVPALLAARAAATPDAPFVRYRGRVWSYAQGWEESLRFAGLLRRVGASGGPPRVASFLAKRPEALWAWFGTLAAGGVHVFVHRAHRGPLLADLLERSRASLLVTEAAALPELPAAPPRHALMLVDEASTGGRLGWDMVTASPPVVPLPLRPSDTATVLFTSGTTGRSKAVLLPHNLYVRGAAHLADAFGFTASDVFHDWLPLSHIGGQLHVTMSAVLAGACLAQQDAFSRSRFWDEVAAAGATVFSGFANVLTLLMMAPERPDDAANGLRIGLIGAIPPELQVAFERRFGVTLLDTYGMSECGLRRATAAPARPAGSARISRSPSWTRRIACCRTARSGASPCGRACPT